MEKYLFITLVIVCVLLGAYAAGLRRQLSSSEKTRHELKKRIYLLSTKQQQDDFIHEVIVLKEEALKDTIKVIGRRLEVAEARIVRLRNTIKSRRR